MTIYLIAGEKSGDFIGSRVIESLKKYDQSLLINGIGGNLMKEMGLHSLFSIDQINMMGFFEIIPHLFHINKLINKTVDDIIAKDSKILVTIDSPGFTYRVAKRLRKKAPEIKLIHIVAPSVWAYKPSRAKKYADLYDHMLTLFPFENEYFTEAGLNTTCMGHPIFQQNFHKKSATLRKKIGIENKSKVITVTPGSRIAEVRRHMPIITAALDLLSLKYHITALFVQPDEELKKLIRKHLHNVRFSFKYTTDRLEAFALSDCALAKSGTNSFEIAASKTPLAVFYKVNWLTSLLVKMMIKIKHVCLINIISNKNIVPEFLQDNFNVKNLYNIVDKMLSDKEYCTKQISESEKVIESIGFNNSNLPSDIAAKTIIGLIQK